MAKRSRYLSGARILPPPVGKRMPASELIERTFLAYNAGAPARRRARLFVERMLEPDVTVGLSLTGALTPAGLGVSCLMPLLKAGFVDWIVSTGANLYHDTHFGLGLSMHAGIADARRPRAPRRGGHPDLRHRLRLRGAPRHRRVLPRGAGAARVPDADGDGGVPLPARALRGASGRRRSARARSRPGGRVAVRRADLHVVPGRLLHRDERRRAAPRRPRGRRSTSPAT